MEQNFNTNQHLEIWRHELKWALINTGWPNNYSKMCGKTQWLANLGTVHNARRQQSTNFKISHWEHVLHLLVWDKQCNATVSTLWWITVACWATDAAASLLPNHFIFFFTPAAIRTALPLLPAVRRSVHEYRKTQRQGLVWGTTETNVLSVGYCSLRKLSCLSWLISLINKNERNMNARHAEDGSQGERRRQGLLRGCNFVRHLPRVRHTFSGRSPLGPRTPHGKSYRLYFLLYLHFGECQRAVVSVRAKRTRESPLKRLPKPNTDGKRAGKVVHRPGITLRFAPRTSCSSTTAN